MPACFLCGDPLTPAAAGRFTHPPVAYCNVKATDSYGIAVDAPVVEAPLAQAFLLSVFAPVDAALPEVFAAAGVPRLGGQSTGRGWSSFALFQRCPYAWQRRYVTPATPGAVMESPALAVGTLLHTYLAVTYQRLIDPAYPLTSEGVDQALRAAGCNPTFLDTAWRVFDGYRLHYTHDVLTPLAVEHDLVDPRTGESCRYDLIAHFPDSAHGRPAGTYIVEHKCLVGATRVFDPLTGRYARIDAVRVGGQVVAHGLTGLDRATVTRSESSGFDEIWKLTTDHGRVLEGNAKHPIWTLRGWVPLGELTTADWVATPRELTGAATIKPSHPDAAISLLGYLLGDGYLGTATVRFSKNDPLVRARVMSLALALAWPVAERVYDEHTHAVEFLGSRQEGVYAFLDGLGLRGHLAATKHVPHDRLTLTNAQVPLLLAGLLDTDGSIDTHEERRNGKVYLKPRIAFVSRSEALARDVQHLFDRLGIETTCRLSSVAYKGERRPVWTTKVTSRAAKRVVCSAILADAIPAVRLRAAAQTALAALHADDDEAVPMAWIHAQGPLPAELRPRTHNRTIEISSLARLAPDLAYAYLSQDVRWERVEAIERNHLHAEVFNLSTDPHQTFVAAGIVTHNSASRFDGDTLEGWANDGEVIGQVMLWHKLRLDLFFGPLQGVLINLLGKQPKNPQYQRVWVKPTTAQVTAHRDDLARWEGLIQLARSTGSFPRARNGCIGRYGRCPHFDHCATGES